MTDGETVCLREYIESRLKDQEKHMNARIDGIEKAIELAAQNLDARLESMNEFRDSLKDQTMTFISRTEFEKTMTGISENHNDRLRTLELSRAELQGKASQGAVNVSLVVAVMSAIISIVGVITRILRDVGVH